MLKAKKTGILIVCMMLGLVGCKSSNEKEESANEIKSYTGDYALRTPYESNDTRNRHQYEESRTKGTTMIDNYTIGSGLMERSKEYFPIDTYAYQEGQVISYSALVPDYYAQTGGLLGWYRDDNPYGLNPEQSTQIVTKEGETISDVVLVNDVYEIDWYKGDELAGLSICIVMDSNVSYTDYTVDRSVLLQYGEEAAKRLESYLRDQPEVGDALPIYMTIYDKASSDQTLPGSFIAEAYLDSKGKKFTSVEDEWAIIPSTRSKELDINVWTQFTSLKKSLQGFVASDIEMIGKGHFMDGNLDELQIRLNMQAYSYTEAVALLQTFASELDVFTNQSYKIKVQVYSNSTLIGVIQKDANASEPEVMRML